MTRDASKRLVSATQMSPVTDSQLASGSDAIVDHQPSAANTTFAAEELKTRMKARGDTGQIKRAEQLLGEIQILKAQAQNTDAKLNAILKHLNIEAPPPTAAATVTHADSA